MTMKWKGYIMKIKINEVITKQKEYEEAALELNKIIGYFKNCDNQKTSIDVVDGCNITSICKLTDILYTAYNACWQCYSQYQAALEQEIEV